MVCLSDRHSKALSAISERLDSIAKILGSAEASDSLSFPRQSERVDFICIVTYAIPLERMAINELSKSSDCSSDRLLNSLGKLARRKKVESLVTPQRCYSRSTGPEPFGLAMIEALACGTPVIPFNRGSVLEIIENGKTGFVVRDIEEAASAVAKLSELDRRKYREASEKRFTATQMATSNWKFITGRPRGVTAPEYQYSNPLRKTWIP